MVCLSSKTRMDTSKLGCWPNMECIICSNRNFTISNLEKGSRQKRRADSYHSVCCAVGHKCSMVISLFWKPQHIWRINNGTDIMDSDTHQYLCILSYLQTCRASTHTIPSLDWYCIVPSVQSVYTQSIKKTIFFNVFLFWD